MGEPHFTTKDRIEVHSSQGKLTSDTARPRFNKPPLPARHSTQNQVENLISIPQFVSNTPRSHCYIKPQISLEIMSYFIQMPNNCDVLGKHSPSCSTSKKKIQRTTRTTDTHTQMDNSKRCLWLSPHYLRYVRDNTLTQKSNPTYRGTTYHPLC